MYRLEDGRLTWHNPDQENAHVEVVVCDAADGRFIPGLHVTATMVSPSGDVLGPYGQELVWHPMLYHYARNWTLPEDGEYTLRVHVDPPTFMRHCRDHAERGGLRVRPPRSGDLSCACYGMVNSCVCGFRWPSFLAPATALS